MLNFNVAYGKFHSTVSEEMEYELKDFFGMVWENILLETKSARTKAKHSKFLILQKKCNCSSHNNEDTDLTYFQLIQIFLFT